MGNVDQTVLMAAAIITALALVALVVGTLALVRASNISRRFSWVSGKEGGIETLPALLRAMEAGQNDIAALKAAFDAAAIEGRTHFKRMLDESPELRETIAVLAAERGRGDEPHRGKPEVGR